MENMGIQKMTKELKKLNPNVSFEADKHLAIIIAECPDCTQINLPSGYYHNDKNGFTNKHNTVSGLYESFALMSKHEYLEMLS